MVSRPLESPRKSAYEPFHEHVHDLYSNPPRFSLQGCTDLRSVTWTKVSLKDAKILATPKTSSPVLLLALHQNSKAMIVRGRNREEFARRGIYLPSLTWGPREMFSWAGRAAFFGGMVSLWCCLISCSSKGSRKFEILDRELKKLLCEVLVILTWAESILIGRLKAVWFSATLVLPKLLADFSNDFLPPTVNNSWIEGTDRNNVAHKAGDNGRLRHRYYRNGGYGEDVCSEIV
jgi:hypothetical protein